MRLALAAAVFALAATHVPTHAKAPHAKAPHAKPAPAVTLRAVIAGGNAQSAQAYAEPAKSKYVTEFPRLLEVRVPGWPAEGDKQRVRFHCATPGCVLASTDQPNDGKYVDRIDPTTYDGHITKGKSFVKIAVEADAPIGTYTVTATPRAGKGERAVAASFTLTSR